jgi:hypothetical protein
LHFIPQPGLSGRRNEGLHGRITETAFDLGILQHVLQAFHRKGGIQGHITRTGTKNAEQGHEHSGNTWQGDADQITRTNALSAQPERQLPGLHIELTIG